MTKSRWIEFWSRGHTICIIPKVNKILVKIFDATQFIVVPVKCPLWKLELNR